MTAFDASQVKKPNMNKNNNYFWFHSFDHDLKKNNNRSQLLKEFLVQKQGTAKSNIATLMMYSLTC